MALRAVDAQHNLASYVMQYDARSNTDSEDVSRRRRLEGRHHFTYRPALSDSSGNYRARNVRLAGFERVRPRNLKCAMPSTVVIGGRRFAVDNRCPSSLAAIPTIQKYLTSRAQTATRVQTQRRRRS